MADKPAGDEHMGLWVYCKQHCRPHSTGWCTVSPEDKVPLKAQTQAEAYIEAKEMGHRYCMDCGSKLPLSASGDSGCIFCGGSYHD